MSRIPRKAHYGIDAPLVPLLMALGVLLCVGIAVFGHAPAWWPSAAILAAVLALFLHASLRGKFVAWRRILRALAWRGDEQVLDLGCGRGAVLTMVAACVPRGRVTGIDIWSSKDQSGNGPRAAADNAAAAGVAGRVALQTADMRELPFADASFDVVVSSMAIHNIGSTAGRDTAIDQAWRVLRPGGLLLIVDIQHARQYQVRLRTLGAAAGRRGLGWGLWWGGPWMSTQLVSARKAGDPGLGGQPPSAPGR
ncbi:MAG: class I SAM-dependent methyltransferase [Xanthomonadales bacterium]|nr:class I SAM-dependent methyltransferase [Xanthomonadales bacterium]